MAERIAAIGRARRVGGYLRTEVGTDPGTGKPTLAWQFDQDRDRRRGRHRRLVRPADQPARRPSTAAEVLTRYKGQEVVERRYGTFKGPLAVAPMFLKTNRRIAALITVICLALLIFCLIERAVRPRSPRPRRWPGSTPARTPNPPAG